jgi:hypothetical protein
MVTAWVGFSEAEQELSPDEHPIWNEPPGMAFQFSRTQAPLPQVCVTGQVPQVPPQPSSPHAFPAQGRPQSVGQVQGDSPKSQAPLPQHWPQSAGQVRQFSAGAHIPSPQNTEQAPAWQLV